MARKKKVTSSAKQERTVHSPGELALDLCLFVFTVGLLFLLKVQVSPVMSQVTYTAKELEPVTHALPFFTDSFSDTFDASLSINVPRLHSSVFAVQVDDCIEQLTVNGKEVIPKDLAPFCSPHDFSRLDLGPYLRYGKNELTLRISDIGVTGGMNMLASNTDPILLFLQIAMLFCIGWFAFRLRAYVPAKRRPAFWLVALLLLAVFLRIVYANATSYHLRAHDTEGHVEYIQYVADNRAIPNAAEGWEFHQPPLYYTSMALLRVVSLRMGLADHQVLQFFSGVSVGLSTVSLLLVFLIAFLLFRPKEWWSIVGFCLFAGTASRLLLLAPNITNEAFAVPLALLLLSLTLLWWSDAKRVHVAFLAFVFSLAFLNKLSAILFLPVLLSCFILHPKLSLRRRMATVMLFCSMTAFLCAWYPAYRLFVEPSREKTVSLGNDGMDPGLKVPRDARHMLTFNPVQILRHPYNDPWDDEKRRGYFLEYFFRSALFGEFGFEHMKPVGYPIAGLALTLLLPFFVGFALSLRRQFIELWPLHVTFVCLLAGAFLYPYLFPFSPNQDFRFSVVLTVPIAYYIVHGIGAMSRLLRLFFAAVLLAFVSLCVVFYGSLFFFA